MLFIILESQFKKYLLRNMCIYLEVPAYLFRVHKKFKSNLFIVGLLT